MIPRAISVVVPVHDEVGAIAGVLAEIVAALDGRDFEIVVVDDASTDGVGAVLARLAAAEPRLRIVTHPRRCGQSTAVRSGVRAARHDWIATLDGDGQNPPDQIPRLIAALAGPGAERVGLVQGERAARRDGFAKRYGSRVANGLRGWLLQDGARDSGCGLKLFRRTAWLDLPFFDHIHRFTPAMMRREGWEVRFVEVGHRPRVAGRSKYGTLDRALVGVLDLLGAAWLIRRRSPLAAPPEPRLSRPPARRPGAPRAAP
jgi:dolichol-phosphate mannosyltransferase